MFKFEGQSVRVVMIEDKPWFVAADILRCLYPNYKDAWGVRAYLNGVDSDEQQYVTRKDAQGLFLGMRGCPKMTIISESALYKIIMRANTSNPAAVRFQQWVTREVLPALRKDGMYVMGEEKVRTGEMSHHLPRKPAGYEVIIARQ